MTGTPLDPLFVPPAGQRPAFPQRVKSLAYRNWFYGLLLRGRHPGQITQPAPDPWPGNPETGDSLFRGEYRFAGQGVKAPGHSLWEIEPPSLAWAECAHGFQWLRHLRACEGPTAHQLADGLVRDWLDRFDRWDGIAWQPHVIAPRLLAWLQNARLVASTDDLVHHSRVLNSMARQLRHLRRTADQCPPGIASVTALCALITGGLCLPGVMRGTARTMDQLEQLLSRQILSDGGFITRNPLDQLAALAVLIPLRDLLMQINHDFAVTVQKAIDRLSPMLRFYRHPDGALALFNGGAEHEAGFIAEVLKASKTRSQPPVTAPRTGYQRIALEDLMLLLDSGGPPPREYSAMAHAGSLAFELSVGKSRLIVNCGDGRAGLAGRNWHRVSRATAAHSALVFNDQNILPIQDNGLLDRRPLSVSSARGDSDEAVSLDTAHDGYRRRYGLNHRRRLTVSRSAELIRGEDELDGTLSKRNRGRPVDLRFHLHPDVTASVVRDGEGVLLRPARGDGWMFHAPGLEARLEESVYLGRAGAVRRAEQIVLSLALSDCPVKIGWALERITK